MLRGGSYYNDASNCRSANRNNNTPDNRNNNNGLRLVLSELNRLKCGVQKKQTKLTGSYPGRGDARPKPCAGVIKTSAGQGCLVPRVFFCIGAGRAALAVRGMHQFGPV